MARPRLYHTPEEKKAANRLKSKKHYNSNRDALLRQRRKVAREKRESNAGPIANNPPKTSLEEQPNSKLATIQDRVQKVSQRFETALAGKSAAGYLTLICVGFEIHYEAGQVVKAKDFIMEKEVEFRKLQRLLERYRDMARNVAGESEEWKEIEAIAARVCKVIYWLDGLLCAAMIDPADLVNRFRTKQLEFQANP